MATYNEATIFAGEDDAVQVVMIPITNVSGWTTEFTLSFADGTKLTKTSALGQITITDAVNGKWNVQINSADTLNKPGIFDFDFQRLDTGAHVQAAYGKLIVKLPRVNPAFT